MKCYHVIETIVYEVHAEDAYAAEKMIEENADRDKWAIECVEREAYEPEVSVNVEPPMDSIELQDQQRQLDKFSPPQGEYCEGRR